MTLGTSPTPTAPERILDFRNLNNVFGRNLNAGNTGSATENSTNAGTYGLQINAPCADFDMVQVVLKNQITTPYNVANVIIAPSNDNSTAYTKLQPNGIGVAKTNNGGLTGWQDVTFGGLLTGTVPAGSLKNPGILVSDWTFCKSLPRLDGVLRPLLLARLRADLTTPSGAVVPYFTIPSGSTDSTNSLFCVAYYSSGDYTTDPSTLSSSTNANYTPFYEFRFMSSKSAARVLCIGGQDTQGAGSTINSNYSWVDRVGTLAFAAGIPLNMINCGWNDATTQQYALFGKKEIDTHLPAITLIEAYSISDVTTPVQADFDRMFRAFIDMAFYARSKGSLPVAIFISPNQNYNLATDNLRKAYIARLKATKFPVIDVTSVLGDTASPQQFKTGLNSNPNTPNDAGYDAIAPTIYQQLMALINTTIYI